MKVDIKEVTKKLNTARIEAGDYKFKNYKEFQEYLKCYDLKVGSYLLCHKLYSTMCKSGRFLPGPIYIEKVRAIYDSVNEYARIHRKINTMKDKEVIQDQEVTPVENQEENQEYDLVQAAIDLLKSKGYRILKPVTEYKEV